MFDHKCSIYVNAKHTLDDAEIKKLGMKDNESYPYTTVNALQCAVTTLEHYYSYIFTSLAVFCTDKYVFRTIFYINWGHLCGNLDLVCNFVPFF